MAEFREASKYRNSTGETGEWLAAARLGRVVKGGRNGPLFQPSFMGAKYPIVDFIVDLLDDDFKPMGMFFFAQVKSSAVADPDSERLSVTVELDDYNALAGMYLPTYLIGVDTVDDKVFIVAATEKLKSVPQRCPKDTTFLTMRFD